MHLGFNYLLSQSDDVQIGRFIAEEGLSFSPVHYSLTKISKKEPLAVGHYRTF